MKNQAKLKEWGLEGTERYYYLRFGKGAVKVPDGFLGVATVCLIPFRACDDDNMGYVRGISFCNPKDQFIKKKGRAIALGRAIKAYEAGESSEPIPYENPAWVLRTQETTFFFSEFNPELTAYEQRLFAPEVR